MDTKIKKLGILILKLIPIYILVYMFFAWATRDAIIDLWGGFLEVLGLTLIIYGIGKLAYEDFSGQTDKQRELAKQSLLLEIETTEQAKDMFVSNVLRRPALSDVVDGLREAKHYQERLSWLRKELRERF